MIELIKSSPHSAYLHNVPIDDMPCSPITSKSKHRILIVGVMTYWVNREGVIRFVENVFPLVRQIISDAEVHVVGKITDESFYKHIKSVDGVSVMGYVDNLNKEYEECSVVAVPIYHGSGTCVKVIEAMMKNRAFVSSPVGVRGLNLEPGRDYLLAQNDLAFAEHIISLLLNPDYANAIAANALNKSKKFMSQDEFISIVRSNIQ